MRRHARPALRALGALAFCAVLSVAQAHACDVNDAHFSTFYNGWRLFSGAVDDVSRSVETGRWNDLPPEAHRLCNAAQGLKGFAGKLDPDKGGVLTARLDRSINVVTALENTPAKDSAHVMELAEQLHAIRTEISAVVPACWLSLASTLHGHHQVACR